MSKRPGAGILPPVMTPPGDTPLPAPWGRHPLPDDEPLALELGPLRLRARRRAGEVWLAHEPGDWTRAGRAGTGARPGAGPAGEAGSPEDWIRWPVREDDQEMELAPTLPPRPLVAEPEFPFRLLPRARARIFVRVPLWVRVSVPLEGERRQLTEVPTVTLSDTWWGTPTEGELCWWLSTTARREVTPEVFEPNVAVCPLALVNRSDDELPVEKIAVRVAHLTLFSDEGRLWADGTRVRYRGAEEGSDLEFSGRPPEEASGAVRVADPREEPPSRGFHARTFARLKSLPGLGGL